MNKQEILKQYKNEDDRLLVAKTLDKLDFSISKNKITNTDFLNMSEKYKIENLFKKIKFTNYCFFGGFENAERTVCIFYPDKFNLDIVKRNYDNILKIIEITLPNELKGKYTHRDYLGGLMKLGIKREKIGDILVTPDGAQIIAQIEVIEYLENNITELTRFHKSDIQIKDLNEINNVEIKKEEIKIMVSSLRLDNIVSELAKTSRTKAEEIIRQERVLVNFETSVKDSRILKENDIITIRGKGRFIIKETIGNTKSGRFILNIEKYV